MSDDNEPARGARWSDEDLARIAAQRRPALRLRPLRERAEQMLLDTCTPLEGSAFDFKRRVP
jgi:hypothetical protein